eukprot:6182261-Pleurochrysis_carterae.AAC.2
MAQLPPSHAASMVSIPLRSHCEHKVLIRRERDGVVGESFADADVMVARKHKTMLVAEVCADALLL